MDEHFKIKCFCKDLKSQKKKKQHILISYDETRFSCNSLILSPVNLFLALHGRFHLPHRKHRKASKGGIPPRKIFVIQ